MDINGFLKSNFDKVVHFMVCIILSVFSILFAMGAANGKEYADMRTANNHWCWYDLLADYAGIVIGGVIHMFLFDCFF